MHQHEKINYIELPAQNMAENKHFFEKVFGWTFTDYGADYTAFDGAGLDGGFYASEHRALSEKGSALVVFYSVDLEATEKKIRSLGGAIVRESFPFPGGRRFHFTDPSGNEYAVWSDKKL